MAKRYSKFNLSHSVKGSLAMGGLIPFLAEDVLPGDKFKVSAALFMRFQPLIAPIMHQVDVFMHYFFVPNRIVWDDWETFITGGDKGQDSHVVPQIVYDPWRKFQSGVLKGINCTRNSVLDYLGLPANYSFIDADAATVDIGVDAMLIRGYIKIYNEWYRNTYVTDAYPEITTSGDTKLETDLDYLNTIGIISRNWQQDYLTMCMPNPQRGAASEVVVPGTAEGLGIVDSGAMTSAGSVNIDGQEVQFELDGDSIDLGSVEVGDLKVMTDESKATVKGAKVNIPENHVDVGENPVYVKLQELRVRGKATDLVDEKTIESGSTAASGSTGAATTNMSITSLRVLRVADSVVNQYCLTVGKGSDGEEAGNTPLGSGTLGVVWAWTTDSKPRWDSSLEGSKWRLCLALRQPSANLEKEGTTFTNNLVSPSRSTDPQPKWQTDPFFHVWDNAYMTNESLVQHPNMPPYDPGHTHPSSVPSHSHDITLPVLPIEAEFRDGVLYDRATGDAVKNMQVLGVLNIPGLEGKVDEFTVDIPTTSGKTERKSVKLPKVEVPKKIGRIWINGGTYPIEVRNNHDVRVPVTIKTDFRISVADIRNAFQMQRYLELNLRAGSRYVEFIKAHFGVTSADSRLQRPEYLGGGKCNFVFSEVLKTSGTTTDYAQGNMAGHGVAATGMPRFTRRFTEHGWLIGLLSVMPRTCYRDRKERRFGRQTQLDYFHPVFQGLGDQAVLNKEVIYNGMATQPDEPTRWDNRVFGYVPRYEEYRRREDRVTSLFKDTYAYWTLFRDFYPSLKTAAGPVLNSSFITCAASDRIWALQTDRMNGILFDIWNQVTAVRPIQRRGTPGRVDHGR